MKRKMVFSGMLCILWGICACGVSEALGEEVNAKNNILKQATTEVWGSVSDEEVQKTNEKGETTRWILTGVKYYDSQGRLSACYEYDMTGNMIRELYNAFASDFGQLHSDESSLETIYQYDYNDIGNMTWKMAYRDGKLNWWAEYIYDADDNLKREEFFYTGIGMSQCNVFNKKGNKVGTKFYQGGEIYSWYGYEYDDAGNMTREEMHYGSSDGGPPITEYEYNEMGSVIKCRQGGTDKNGNFSEWNWDEYEYDNAGNLLWMIKHFNGDPDFGWAATEDRYKYEYDDKGNMIRESHLNESGNVVNWNESEYDEAGNKVRTVYYDSGRNVVNWIEYTYAFQ